MAKCRFVFYRILVVLVAMYGVMLACVCMDHTSSRVPMAACHHCSGGGADTTVPKMASHHRCCSMERVPMAVEEASSSNPITMAEVVMFPSTSLFSDTDFYKVALSTPIHAPPGDIPLYFTTQRFLI